MGKSLPNSYSISLSDLVVEDSVPNALSTDWQRASWLLSEYDSNEWLVTDTSPKPPVKIRYEVVMSDGSLLTNTQHSHLLDTIKRMTFGLRTGPHATVTTSNVHSMMANVIVTWVLWMNLHGISRFEHLSPEDFDAFLERAIYGSGHLLEYVPRLRKHLNDLRESGTQIPNKGRLLDQEKLLIGCGIDPNKAYHDAATSYLLFEVAKEEGLYLYPRQIKLLQSSPPANARIANIPLLRLLQPWEYQWTMRRTLPGDKITFDPFPNDTITQVACSLGAESGRTATVPVKQAMNLIDRSIRWVLDYSDSLITLIECFEAVDLKFRGGDKLHRRQELNRLFANYKLMPQGPGRPWPLTPTKHIREGEGLAFSCAIRCLFAACFVVIAAFTARRHDEIKMARAKGSANEDCICIDEQGYWIELWIEKTVKDWDKTPCPEIVVKAVEVLRKLSAPSREITENPELFQFKLLGRDKSTTIRLRKALNELTSHLDIPLLDDGSKWVFTPHQLRRFFAIIYMWRYEFGELSALNYQLRHYNLDMTRRYVTAATRGAIFKDVQSHHTLSILTDAAMGRRDISGHFGERFKRLAKKLRTQLLSTVHIVSEQKLRQRIQRLVERSGKRLKGFLWGYCACGPTKNQLRSANCLKHQDITNAIGPDLSHASPSVCALCPHHMTHEAFAPYLKGCIELHEKAADDPSNGRLIRNASKTHLEVLREHYDRSFKRSEPLEMIDG